MPFRPDPSPAAIPNDRGAEAGLDTRAGVGADPGPRSPYDFSVVRQLRQRESLTLAQLSARSGISVPVISKLERNQTTAELETLAKIAAAFGMAPSNLVALAEASLAHRKTADGHEIDGFFFTAFATPTTTAFWARLRAAPNSAGPTSMAMTWKPVG